MADGGEIKIRIDGDASGLENAINKADNAAQKLGAGMLTELNSGLELASKAIKTIGSAMQKTVGQFATFEDSMLQVKATMNATDADYAKMTEAAKQAGATTRYTASESAQALNYMALAGYDTATAIEALPQVLSLAQAGGGSLAATSDMLTDSLSALGLGVDYMQTLSDQMATAAQKSNTSVMQLGDGILTVGGTAANLKNGTAELAASLGVLANNGIKGAEGGTHLRNMILRLQQPTKDGAAVLAKYTNGVYDAEGNMRSLDAIFGELNQNMATLTQAERDAALSDVFRVTDLAAASAMLKGMNGEYAALYSNIVDSDGACADMAQTMESGLAGSMRSLSSAWEGFQISIGDGISSDIGVQGLTDNLTALVRELTQAFENGGWDGLAESVAAAAPSMIQTFGATLAQVFGTLGKQLPTFMKSFTQILPELIGGAFAGAEGLLEYGSEAAAVLVEGIVASFPDYAWQIADGITNIFYNAMGAVTDIGATAALGTLDTLFGSDFLNEYKKYKLPPLSPERLFGDVSSEYKKEVHATIDGTLTATELSAAIEQKTNELTGQIDTMYNNIVTAFTDGKPDTELVVQNLLEGGDASVESMYQGALDLINSMDGLTDEEREAAIAKLNAWKEGSSAWVAEMTGKSAEYVQAHLSELQGYIDEYKAMMDQFNQMAQENSVEGMAFKRVSKGASSSQRDIDNALDYANAGKNSTMGDITEKYNKQRDYWVKQLNNGKISEDAYSSIIDGITRNEQEEVAKAEQKFNEQIGEISEGLFNQMNGDQQEAIENAASIYGQASEVEQIGQKVQETIDNGGNLMDTLDPTQWTSDLQEGFAEFLTSGEGEQFGFTPEQLQEYFTNGFGEGDERNAAVMAEALGAYQQQLVEGTEQALSAMDGSPLETLFQDGGIAGLWDADMNVGDWMLQYMPWLTGAEPITIDGSPTIEAGEMNTEGITDGIGESIASATEGEPVTAEMTVQPEATFEQPEGLDVGAVFGDLGDQTIPMNPTIDASGAVAQATAAKQQIATEMDASSEARTAGSNTAAGLAAGLATAVSTAATLGAAAGRAFTAAYKANQQIASPSKVMRRMGAFTVEGLAKGLNDGARVATAEARALARSLNDTLSISPKSAFDLSGVSQSFATAINGSSRPVYLDGQQIASIQGLNNSSAIAFENARSSRGVGAK